LVGSLSEQERQWGNYGPGRFGWMLAEIEPLPAPIDYKGRQGLFDVSDGLLSAMSGVIVLDRRPPHQARLL
jgi:hypothetical protein